MGASDRLETKTLSNTSAVAATFTAGANTPHTCFGLVFLA
jgi:hypothetical protein